MENPLYALAKGLGTVNNLIRNPGYLDKQSALQSMADDTNAEAAAPAPQKSDGSPQDPRMASYLQRLAILHAKQLSLAAADPNNSSAMEKAQGGMDQQAEQSNPFYSQYVAMNAQQEAAKIEQTKSEATKNLVVDTPTGKVLVNPQSGQTAPIGTHTYASSEVQKLADLSHFAGTQAAAQSSATGSTSIPSVQPLITAAFRTPEQQLAANEKESIHAKTSTEADQDIVNTKAATDQLIPALNQLDSLNNDPNLPSVLPEEQSEASNILHGLRLQNGATADAFKRWNQTNGSKLVGGIQQFIASGTGTRMDLPIAHALMDANGISLSGTKSGRADRINQARIELYNANIIAKNRSNQFKDPNFKPSPTIPLNFKGKIYTMSELQNAANAKKMNISDVINKVKSSGSLVVE